MIGIIPTFCGTSYSGIISAPTITLPENILSKKVWQTLPNLNFHTCVICLTESMNNPNEPSFLLVQLSNWNGLHQSNFIGSCNDEGNFDEKAYKCKLFQPIGLSIELNNSIHLVALHKKWSFPLRIYSVNVIKSSGTCGFGHIYWRIPYWKTSFFVQCRFSIILH